MQKPEFKMSEEIPWGSAGRGEECGTSGRAEKEKKERRYQSASWGLASAGGGGKLNHLIGSRYKFMVIFEVLCFNSVFFPSPVHQALVDLQLQTGVQVRFLSTWKDFTDYITMLTKAVAEAPFKWVGSQFLIYHSPTSCIFSYSGLFFTCVCLFFPGGSERRRDSRFVWRVSGQGVRRWIAQGTAFCKFGRDKYNSWTASALIWPVLYLVPTPLLGFLLRLKLFSYMKCLTENTNCVCQPIL